jgi:hypothetical protein
MVSAEPGPGDVDVLLVMAEGFRSEGLAERERAPFEHSRARLTYGCDVFWIRDDLPASALSLMLEVYQTDKRQRPRGIVELVDDPE